MLLSNSTDLSSISIHCKLLEPSAGSNTSVRAPAPGPSSIARKSVFFSSSCSSSDDDDTPPSVDVASFTKAFTIFATVLPSRKKFCPKLCFGLNDPAGKDGVACVLIVSALSTSAVAAAAAASDVGSSSCHDHSPSDPCTHPFSIII